MTKSAFLRILVALLIVVVVVRVMTFFSGPPENLGARNGRLAELPESPNAVSSQTTPGSIQHVPPLPVPPAVNPTQIMQRLVETIQGMPGSRLITRADNYLHVEFRSRVFGFVDDVEFLLDASQGEIQVRSASRLGYFDLGANKKRVTRIRELWAAAW
jgi:uncharacterized protein (DUF1499 family)